MTPMVTVHATADGVRISRVTEHGETVVVPDVESRILAVRLWANICAQKLDGHANVFKELEDVVARADALQRRLDALLQRLEKATHALETAVREQAPKLPARQTTTPYAQ